MTIYGSAKRAASFCVNRIFIVWRIACTQPRRVLCTRRVFLSKVARAAGVLPRIPRLPSASPPADAKHVDRGTFNPPSGLTGLAPTADINSACRAMATRASHALNIVVGSCVARWRAHIVAPGSNRYGDLDRDGVSAGYARRCALPVLKAFATIQAGIVV